MILINLIDIVMGIISAGLVYMIIMFEQPHSGIIFTVILDLICLVVAVACLRKLYKQSMPGKIACRFKCYFYWKVFEFFLLPVLDIYTI